MLISGCGVTYNSNPQFFKDTGNEISNYKLCHKLAKASCDSSIRCKYYVINTLVCDNGECYCD